MAVAGFEQIRKDHLEAGTLFVDNECPSEEDIAFFSRQQPNVEWLRPKELCQVKGSEAKVFEDSGIETDDTINLRPQENFPFRFNRLLLAGQSFNDDKYAGIFMFKFWRYGKTVEVVIDDRLPCYEGNILSVRKKRPHELINPLVEKALAKSYGGYQAIENYTFEHMMTDYCGRCVEPVPLDSTFSDLVDMFFMAVEMGSWIIATSKDSTDTDSHVLPNGLVTCYPYVVERVIKMKDEDGNFLYLVRVKPRWPMAATYTGPWSESSPEWTGLSSAARSANGLTPATQNIIWMRLIDLIDSCSQLEFCHLPPQLGPRVSQLTWSLKVLHSEWKRGALASGSKITSLEIARWSPRFLLTISNCDYDDGTATIIFELMQKNRRKARLSYLPIAYHVHQLAEQPEIPVSSRQSTPVFTSQEYRVVRSLVYRHKLAMGQYILYAATDLGSLTGEFMLRMFSEQPHDLVEMVRPAIRLLPV